MRFKEIDNIRDVDVGAICHYLPTMPIVFCFVEKDIQAVSIFSRSSALIRCDFLKNFEPDSGGC